MDSTGGWINILVWGKAQPAGSKTAMPVRRKDGSLVMKGNRVVTNTVDSNRHAKSWMQEVRKACADAYTGPLLDEAVEVRLTFVRVRPKCHYRTGRNAHLLKEDAPAYPISKPDVLKLSRAVEDAMTGIIYTDDCRTVCLEADKVWGPREAVLIRVRRIKERTDEVDLRALFDRMGGVAGSVPVVWVAPDLQLPSDACRN